VATHGVSDQGGDFFVATDSVKGRTLRSGIAVAEVLDEVARADADSGEMGRRLVLLDACRERLTEGTRGEGDPAMTKSFADAIARAKGVAILSGSTLGGFAYDDPERKNGVFTAAVLDGLTGQAPAGPDGWITVRTLADFVQQRVVNWVRRRRPDHAAKSLGIGRQIEATAEGLPLAPHPAATQQRQRYRARREAALARARENLGKILTGQLWDQIFALLPAEGRQGPEVEQLLEEIEALDGKERSQRGLRDFLREFSGGPSLPVEEPLVSPTKPLGRPAPSIITPEPPADPQAGTAIEGPLGMRMRFVPAGTYTIGSPEGEPGRDEDETLHEVTLTRGFWLGETLVTQEQWKRLVPGPKQPSFFKSDGEDLPVESITWYEAVEFANRLSDQEGLPQCYRLIDPEGTLGGGDLRCGYVTAGLHCPGYRLPTEAEWEVAARAGGDPAKSVAPDLNAVAWYDQNAGGATHPVGQKAPNGWGLRDPLGNVYEWTGDWNHRYPTGRVVDPLGPPGGSSRVIRGGSWGARARFVRAAYRFWHPPGNRYSDVGFRLARGQSALQPKVAEPRGQRPWWRRGEPE